MRSMLFLLVLFNLGSLTLFGQRKFEKPIKHEFYLEALRNSKDSLYNQILNKFDDYLNQHSGDVNVRIEKCKLIGTAYYDSYDDYNPNYEEFDLCLEALAQDFPNNQDVLLYKLENLYGDSAIAFCKNIIHNDKLNSEKWDSKKLALVHEKLARQYSYSDQRGLVINHAQIAERLNDTLDLSLLKAQQYIAINNYDKAKIELLSNLDSLDLPWESREKGSLFLTLGMPKKALDAFNFAKSDSNIWVDNGAIASALTETGMYAEAREFLKKDVNSSYNNLLPLHKLFIHDFKHSPADTTLASYNEMTNANFLNDAFGKYRFMMIFRTPFSGWSLMDVVKLLLFGMVVLLLFVIPYLWILPLHYISKRYNLSNDSTSLNGTWWGLSDFWIITTAIMILEFVSLIVFNYQSLVMYMVDDYYTDDIAKISQNQADLALFYFFGMLIITLVFLRKADFRFLKSGNWSYGKSIGLGFLLAVLLRSTYFSLVGKGLLPNYEPSVVASVIDFIASINDYYDPFIGFLFIVVLIPFYEEYIFRAIALCSMEKKVRFITANIIQSFFFALLHENLSLFVFYFLFGMIAGYFVKKSGSLMPSITFHMSNNLFAFIAISKIL